MNKPAKFLTIGIAESFSYRSQYPTGVILGDDGLYWVPRTRRDLYTMIAVGYEIA